MGIRSRFVGALAATCIVLLSSTANACLVGQDSDYNDGTTISRSIPLNAITGSNLELNLTSGSRCFIGIDIGVPTRISLSLEAASRENPKNAARMVLDNPLLGESIVTPVSRVVPETDAETLTYELPPAHYNLILYPPNDSKQRLTDPLNTVRPRASGTHRLVVTMAEPTPLPRLVARARANKIFHLDRYSGSAFLEFHVNERAEIELELDFMPPWAPGLGKPPVIFLRDEEGHNFDPEYTVSKPGNAGERYHYTIKARSYFLQLLKLPSHWPRIPLNNAQADAQMVVRVAAIHPKPLPAALIGLDEWLTAIGIDDTFEVIDFYNLDYDSVRLSPDLRELLEKYRHRDVTSDPDAYDYPYLELWKRKFLVTMRNLVDRDKLEAIEHQFASTSGVSFWDRVLRKISLTTNIPTADIAILMPVPCDAGQIYESMPGVAGRYGSVCLMGSAGVKIEGLIREEKIAATGVDIHTSVAIDLSPITEKFFQTFLPADGTEVQYHTRTANYVDVVVRGLSGHVVKGGREWEKIQISLLNIGQSEGNHEIRVFVDGQLASGIGSYPPDSQFTKSMEPEHAQALTDYARVLATSFGEFVTREQ